jgi:predicted  nucleic acid-binding Zn-ribbon protein
VILTAHRDYFDATGGAPDPFAAAAVGRARAFEACAVEWLTRRFGADVIHARADHDETAYHIHAVILPRAEKVSQRRGRQKTLQPSIHPLIADYEAAQDDAGAFFAAVGLRRGERTAAARRAARAADLSLPPKPRHTSPAEWRAEQARKTRARLAATASAGAARETRVADREVALRAREAQVDARAATADATLAVVEAVATGAVEIEPDTGKMINQRPEAAAFIDRARRDPAAANKALHALRNAYARLAAAARREALAAAESLVAAARAAVASAAAKAETTFADLLTLRDRMVAALPMALRKAFQHETRGDVRDARRALGEFDTAATAASINRRPPRKPEAR